jgi:DNA-binding transcriptional MerR regulator/methanogenic corrinoid protein MtbC1
MDRDGKERTQQTEPTSPSARHTVGAVVRRTGLSAHVLRAWERRYGAVRPVRTAGGQRLYTDDDLVRLRLLRRLTAGGWSISSIAGLPDAELERLAAEPLDVGVPAAGPEGGPGGERAGHVAETGGRGRSVEGIGAAYVEWCIAAGARMDEAAVHGLLWRAAVSLGSRAFLEEVLVPLLREVGGRWHAGELGPAQEHVVSQAVRRVMLRLLETLEVRGGGPVMVVTTLAGEQHEFGALMASLVARDEGWRAAYLGPSLPAEEVVRSVRVLNAEIAALSLVNLGEASRGVVEVGDLRAGLPVGVDVVLGGAGALQARRAYEAAGARVLESAAELREWLRARREAGAA